MHNRQKINASIFSNKKTKRMDFLIQSYLIENSHNGMITINMKQLNLLGYILTKRNDEIVCDSFHTPKDEHFVFVEKNTFSISEADKIFSNIDDKSKLFRRSFQPKIKNTFQYKKY